MIQTKRVYDAANERDGERFLVDRLWPRGFKKEGSAKMEWLKAVAPSQSLRQWFGHDPAKWPEFRRRYRAELQQRPEAWKTLLQAAQRGPITLLFSARDTEHNNALVLQAFLEQRLKSRSGRKGGAVQTRATQRTC
jgi:uncharacterized protein YeaO (DUF488 family)